MPRTITNEDPLTNDIIPARDNMFDLGSSARRWRNLYLADSLSVIDVSSDLLPSVSTTYSIGSTSLKWLNIYSSALVSSAKLYATAASNQLNIGTAGNLTMCSFPAATSDVTLSFPNITDTVCARTVSETLSNKTLASPIITGNMNTNGNISGIVTCTAITLVASAQLTVTLAIDMKGYYLLLNSSGAQSITTNSLTLFTTWTVTQDTSTMFNAGTSTVTIPLAGLYQIVYYGGYASATSTGSTVSAIILTNGANTVLYQTRQVRTLDVSAQEMDHSLTVDMKFAANDTIKFQCYQNLTGASVNFGAANGSLQAIASIRLLSI